MTFYYKDLELNFSNEPRGLGKFAYHPYNHVKSINYTN